MKRQDVSLLALIPGIQATLDWCSEQIETILGQVQGRHRKQLTGEEEGVGPPAKRKYTKRHFTPEARQKMKEAQALRWAKYNAAKMGKTMPKAVKVAPEPQFDAIGRQKSEAQTQARIANAAKAREAQRRRREEQSQPKGKPNGSRTANRTNTPRGRAKAYSHEWLENVRKAAKARGLRQREANLRRTRERQQMAHTGGEQVNENSSQSQ
jgi:hypothetical protein